MSEIEKPNRHLMALVTYLSLVPLVYFIPDLIGQFLPDNKLLKVAVAVGIIVPIISYVVMPIAMRILAWQKTKM